MIPLEQRIAKVQCLLRRMDEDRPHLQQRLAVLGTEYRQSAIAFAGRLRVEAEAELQRLIAERKISEEWARLSPSIEPQIAETQIPAEPNS